MVSELCVCVAARDRVSLTEPHKCYGFIVTRFIFDSKQNSAQCSVCSKES